MLEEIPSMRQMRYLLSVFTVLSLSCTAAFSTEHLQTHWAYSGEKGPENWAKIQKEFVLCKDGSTQSPINLSDLVGADLEPITLSYQPFAPNMINTGHTVQVNVPEGNRFSIGEDVFQLVQFHFHTPSEHRIASKAFPMEVHFVHKRLDGVLGVIGVMVEEGEPHAEIARIWPYIPTQPGAAKQVADIMIDATKLLPKEMRYYRLMGSLTTPPCSEGVNWFILQDPITASKGQIAAFRKLFPMNARPLQHENHRLIIKDTP